MPASQSSPPCARLGLLLLTIGVISFHLPEIPARPTDFWCNCHARKNMEKRIVGLRKDMLQQKRAEVVGALQMFQDGVQATRNQATLHCQILLLERLGHHITNYLAVINRLRIQNDTVTTSHFSAQNCSDETSLNKVLEQYGKLVKGKLERLAIDLQEGICKVEDRATDA